MGLNTTEYGRRMKARRALLGYSQQDLADISGVNVNSIARYEAGINCPSLEAADKLARALGTSIDALVGLEPIEERKEAMA